MVGKRPLQNPSSTLESPIGQSNEKKIKVEQQVLSTEQSSVVTNTTSGVTTPSSIGEGQSLPNTTISTAQHATVNQAGLAVSTMVGATEARNGDSQKDSSSASVQNNESSPSVNTSAPAVPITAAQATSQIPPGGAVAVSTITANPNSASTNVPRLSNKICDRNRNHSSFSSGESSGRKTEISSLSSGSSHSDPLNASSTPLVSEATPSTTDTRSMATPALISQSPPFNPPVGLGEKKTSPPPPLKSTKMVHLRKKYLAQLEYMHREFKKLERQLLGAKSTSKNLVESAGSRERREKLHNFIVHVEETLKQIHVGCSIEHQGKGVTSNASASSKESSATGGTNDASNASQDVVDEEAVKKEFARSSALTKLTKEKEEEENVQKLEEHILANLLPVKERLTKQLAAQQGAAKNPAGMPRRGLQPPGAAARGRAHSNAGHGAQTSTGAPLNPLSAGPIPGPTAHSQFGRPLKGGGSSLTQKLHGKTLGSQDRARGHGVGSDDKPIVKIEATKIAQPSPVNTTPRKVVYAGMTPGSRQVRSGVSAASGVHDMVIESTRHQIDKNGSNQKSPAAPPPPPPASEIGATRIIPAGKVRVAAAQSAPQGTMKTIMKPIDKPNEVKSTSVPPPPPGLSMTVVSRSNNQSLRDPTLTEEERQERILRKKMRKVEKRRTEQERQRQIMLHNQQQQAQRQQQSPNSARRAGKQTAGNMRAPAGQRKGPRTVEYVCALCNEIYKSTCEYNPWWALSSHECGKCGKTQIPRLDISSPANAIEYHPALLAHVVTDDSKNSNKVVSVSAIPKHYNRPQHDVGTGKAGTVDLNASDGELSCSDSDDSDFGENMSPSAQAENEDFGKNYSGPKFSDFDASRLLILMGHASTCPGNHKNQKTRDVCNNIKFMMMHVRDCPGTTSSYDICPFPWCRKTKHLLYHLVSCASPSTCKICQHVGVNSNLRSLVGLNKFREQKRKKQNEASLSSTSQQAYRIATNKGISSGQTSGSTMAKKIAHQRRIPRNGIMASGSRVNRGIKVSNPSKHPALSSQNGITKRSALPVPSPIPTVGLATNPLTAQNTTVRTQRQVPIAKQNFPTSSMNKSTLISKGQKPTKSAISTPSHARTIQGLANPLTIHPSNTYAPLKNSSPPNPLKVLPVEKPTAPIKSFPTLPAQISSKVDEMVGGINAKEGHDVLQRSLSKIKIEAGNQ